MDEKKKKKLPAKATAPVPIGATVSRATGKITWTYSDDIMDQLRFGQIMNRMSRIEEVFEDCAAKAKAQAG